MSDIAIRVENLSKLYRMGQFVSYKTLRESMVNAVSAPFRRLHSAVADSRSEPQNPDFEYIWALKDVSFEVKQGEAIGIIGANGAGKTTLLRILTRITTPTEGYAEIRGRVGSLLEVGTGFHTELTGRENIYLNGAVLGMKKKEIERKFDEIVDFAGEVVEKFIDTPLKRYSSGMQVRLAFAVAAHLEPEILLIDEVLAVGDVEFQRKCLGKMGEVTGGGRTVLFVSHNMSAIRRLCPSVILLEEGRLAVRGNADEVIERYLSGSKTLVLSQQTDGPIDLTFPEDPSKAMQIRRVRILDHKGTPTADIDNRYPFTTELEYEVRQPRAGAYLNWVLYTADDTIVCASRHYDINQDRAIASKPGSYVARLKFPGDILNAGLYRLGVDIIVHDRGIDRHDVTFHVSSGYGFGQTLGSQRKGVLLMPLPWQIEMKQPREGRVSE